MADSSHWRTVKALPFDRGLGERIKASGRAIADVGQGFLDASKELGAARDEIRALEWQDAADSVMGLGDAANAATAALLNVPSGFKVALAR